MALGTTATGVPDLAFTLLGPACATVLVPVPDIKVNSSDCPITVSVEDTVSIAISLDPGDAVSETADWWLVELTPAGTLNYLDLFTASFTPGFATTYQGPLFGFGSTLILNLSDLTIGSHTYYFIIDTNINGSLDVAQLYFDYVLVTSEATKSFNTEAQ